MAARKPSTPPTTVLLVRHGQTTTTGKLLPGRAKGLHLADLGREQADRAAARIAELPAVAAIYTSPLERTRETAAPIAAARGLKPIVDKGLLECDFGDWTGQELKQLVRTKEWTTIQRTPSAFRFPNGESFLEMQHRMVGTIDRLKSAHPGATIVCVSHADPIKVTLAHALGTHLDQFQRLVINPCSISVITWAGPAPVVLTVNSTGGPLTELVPA